MRFLFTALVLHALTLSCLLGDEVSDKYRIEVTVYDTAHAGCGNAQVQLLQGEIVLVETQTAPSGRAILLARAQGSYTVRISLPGFEPVQKEVNVAQTEITSIDIMLERLSTHKEKVDVEGSASPVDRS